MSTELVLLALLMAAVTYPARALPLLTPGIERLPAVVIEYLRLVGPACLAALAAVSTVVVRDDQGRVFLRLGVEVLAVVGCLVVVARWRNLFVGLALAAGGVAITRAVSGATL